MEKNRTFSQQDVNKRVFNHVPKATLRTWLLQGLYGWQSVTADKRGDSRTYTIGHLYQIGLVEALSSLSISTHIIKDIMTKIGDTPSMDKVVFISKHPVRPREISDKHHKSFYMWSPLIINPEQLDSTIALYRDKYKIAIFVVIDCAIIKNFIDTIVKDI